MSRIYVFWDNSNIFAEAKTAAATRDGVLHANSVRIQMEALHHLAVWNRESVKTFVVGSQSAETKLLAVLSRIDAHFELYERGAESGTEQAVDAALQVHMLRALVDESEPCVAVLLTGDGAGYENGVGFHADLERMAKRGWGVEVLSWSHSCNPRLRAWAEKVGVFIPLDKHFEWITFVERGRRAKPIPLTGRPLAAPRVPVPPTPSSPPPPPSAT